jgi:dihydrofolate reductase
MGETMRRIVAFDHVSADGYFAAPDGSLSWVVQDPEISKAAGEGMPQTGAILFGRKTYQMFEQFWPKAAESPNPPDPHGAQSSEGTKAMAVFLTETPKLVFSKTLKDPKWKNTRVLAELDPRAIER